MNKTIIGVVGLGYVGLPLAVGLSKYFKVVGFDVDHVKILELQNNFDRNGQMVNEEITKGDITYTVDSNELCIANFFIIAVPTPVNARNHPDLSYIKNATRSVGRALNRGDVVVYESTVYPGLTENYCIPELEEMSTLDVGLDFNVGYSPERINPGDSKHTLDKVTKIISAQNGKTLDRIEEVYSTICPSLYKAPDIRTAEAAKVIENAQRDINVAFMNELAIIFDAMGINTHEVLKAARTKWNFLDFVPGLVGGHCISVDPYYLAYQSQAHGYTPEVILSGRKINDSMGKYIAHKHMKEIIKNNQSLDCHTVGIFGLTFKENISDLRNSKVFDIISEFKSMGVEVIAHDPLVTRGDVINYCGSINMNEAIVPILSKVDSALICVAHNAYRDVDWSKMIRAQVPVAKNFLLGDIKNVYTPDGFERNNFKRWAL